MTGIESGLLAGAALATSETVKLAIKDLHSFVKKRSTELSLKWKAERSIEELYLHVNSIRHVKTIWQIDRSINLKEFYVSPHLKVEADCRVKIDAIDNLHIGNSILIEGIAGQGKSTFMRYLCSNEMIDGTRIPIFIELRKIKKGETIFDHIIRYCDILGITLSKELLIEFVKTGRLSIYLDGFDELDSSIKHEIISDIELISLTQGNGKIIITSRPGQTIRSMPCLKVVKLDNLIKDEYKEVINKISENKEYAEALIKVIDSHKKGIKNLLCTPLFVTLLVISYKSYQHIPEQLSDFYDSLFRVLLQRHDGTKPAYSRPRLTKLNDSDFRSGFESFCYHSKKFKSSVFSHQDIVKIAEACIESSNIGVDPEDFIKDISEVTCLIINDGDEWQFIHKSIQEYFLASYIKNSPEVKAQKIHSLLTKNHREDWESEIKFLAEIDEYRFAKYFFIPCIKKLIENSSNLENTKPHITPNLIKNILGCYQVVAQAKDEQIYIGLTFTPINASPLHESFIDGKSFYFGKVYEKIQKKDNNSDGIQNTHEINLSTILGSPEGKKEAHDYASSIINELHTKGVAYEKMIKRIEAESIDDELFSS